MESLDETVFFKNFRDFIVPPVFGPDNNENNADNDDDRRIEFMSHQYNMIPAKHMPLIFSLTRSFPTPPVYPFLVIGMLGTNCVRFGAVSRPKCHIDHYERAGCFYNFIGESRLGKGICMKLLWTLGRHIEKLRDKNFHEYISPVNLSRDLEGLLFPKHK